ncbi:serine hydrolase [Bacillus sp. S/N-304-OC-R1]|uniref:serine hydrolase n=1 Tax=Bacillus sp. S/N-304-OC-R1 TaxID=2758034 RepID=UPI001C8EC208|nr:serine hydrolase [Bacillus sp. S/N-304-OC-R1]MBY0121210.1 serine hydrolase [Bacillus sp. S/N-304-OC-R1]
MDIEKVKKKVSEIAAQCDGRVGLVIETGEDRIEINPHDRFSSASLIKIPILLEGFRQYDRGALDLQEYLPVQAAHRVGGAGVLQALSDDLKLKIVDLLALMIIVSDNTATNMLIDRIGMNKINQCIKDHTLEGTELNRKMMDLDAAQKGMDNHTTASDIVWCLRAIDEQNFLTKESSIQAFNILEKQQFKNKLCDSLDSEAIQIASKTGELPGVEHDCVIMKYGGNTLYAAVLIDGLPNREAGRKTFTQIGIVLSQFIMT